MAVSTIQNTFTILKKSYNYGSFAFSQWATDIVNDSTVPVGKPLIIRVYDSGYHILIGMIHESRLYATFVLIDYYTPLKQYEMYNGTVKVRSFSYTE